MEPVRMSDSGRPLLCIATRHMKVRFVDQEAAENALADVREMRSHGKAYKGKVEKRTYQCPECRDWHLTSRD